MQVETGKKTTNKESEEFGELKSTVSTPTPDSCESDGITGDSFARSSPTRKSSFSAIVNVSKIQVSFAERTAAEMEEIVSWYKKYEGNERLKKENQQSQAMPDNAMIVVDDDKDDDGNVINEENDGDDDMAHGSRSIDQQQEFKISDAETVAIKDYSTPAQKRKETEGITPTVKKTQTSMFSVIRSLSKSRMCGDPPPRAIKLRLEGESESETSPSTTNSTTDNTTRRVEYSDIDEVSEDSIRDSPKPEDFFSFRDEEEKVLAMLSPVAPSEAKSQSPIESTVDEEQHILAMLSPVTLSGKSRSGKPAMDQVDGAIDCNDSTEQKAQIQIAATDDLIRNTQNMAQIILELQQSSTISGKDDDDDDDDDAIVNIDRRNANLDENNINESQYFETKKANITSSSSESQSCNHNKGNLHIYNTITVSSNEIVDVAGKGPTRKRIFEETPSQSLRPRKGQETNQLSDDSNSLPKETKQNTKKPRSGGFEAHQLYQFLLIVLICLGVGLASKFIKDEEASNESHTCQDGL